MASFFRNCRFIASLIVFVLGVGAVLPVERDARASQMDPDTLTVTRDGVWGLLGGTLAGLVAFPLGGSVREVFLGSSVGLYLGIVVGIYSITHRGELVPEGSFSEGRVPDRARQGGERGGAPGQLSFALPGPLPGQAPSIFNQQPPATALVSIVAYRF